MSSRHLVFFLATFITALPTFSQTVPSVDLSSLSPSDFADDELDLPYYLAHFSRIANSVDLTGPHRGFIDIAVWREPEFNTPGNPRIMENILSLAFFYTTDRPWNPYYNHPAVRGRLEAALSYWVGLQHPNGLFTHDGRWALSVTAFATKFMAETLRLLQDGPTVHRDVLRAATAAQRRAIVAVLTRDELLPQATRFSNQFTNVWGSALAYLDLHEDAALRRLFEGRFRAMADDLQSPAGYFYEHGGADWTYDIETHHSNHRMVWHYVRGSDLADTYAEEVRRWYEWLAYNAAIEPDGSGFTMNHSFETRLSFPFYRENREGMYGETCTPLAEEVIFARAFCESGEERARRIVQRRADMRRTWPRVEPLRVGSFDAYSPYAFLHRDHITWYPTASQKARARELLPYVASDRFTHQRGDSRNDLSVTYVRRPAYYATFSTGEELTPQQRFGLGLVWIPEVGAVLQSQPGSEGAWGTASFGETIVDEKAIRSDRVRIGGNRVAMSAGKQELSSAPVSIAYDIGGRGNKTVNFLDDAIEITTERRGAFIETIPLLLAPRDRIDLTSGSALVDYGSASLRISFDPSAEASLDRNGRRVGTKRTTVLKLQARNRLTYRLEFHRDVSAPLD